MAGRRIRGLRWGIIGLVRAGTAINFLDRQVLGGTAPTVIAAIAAITARETYRVNINDLGNPDAVPMAKAEYEKKRAEAAIAAAA